MNVVRVMGRPKCLTNIESGYSQGEFVGGLDVAFSIFADEDVRVPREVEA